MAVHNHGTEDGPGIHCVESLVDGELKGACLAPAAECWCGGKVLALVPGERDSLSCINNYEHEWKADTLTAAKTTLEGVTEGPWILTRETCDCNDGMCGHGAYPYAIHGPLNELIANNADRYTVAHTEQYGHEITEISELTDADAQFIADARVLLPALVAEVERNRDLIAEFRRRDEVATRVIERLRGKQAAERVGLT